MRTDTLDVLRCPYCGGRLELVTSSFHRVEGDDIHDGLLGCHCCVFPVVAGIPVLHLQPATATAQTHIEDGRPDRALAAMFGFDSDQRAGEFWAVASSDDATYRDIVGAFGPEFEGGYFLYRFSDPTFLVAQAVVRAVGGTVLREGGRAVDLCGGSGHLTRSLSDLSTAPPVLADLYFPKIWLARRFTAPGCEPVCCDGNAPFPFARGAFRFAMCSDAFMFIWTKRQFVLEMLRLVDDGSDASAAVISHTHNQKQWNPSNGQPLPPDGYRDLFETLEPRLFGETMLLSDLVDGGPIDLTRRDPPDALDAEPALTIVASRNPAVFARHPIDPPPSVARGELRLNPLYAIEVDRGGARLRLQFPSDDYADEYGACRRYLPDEVTIDAGTLRAIESGALTGAVADLARRLVVLDLPKRYY